MVKPNITYLLGAGASYGTIPILNEFSKSLDAFADIIYGRSIKNYSLKIDFVNSMKWLASESKNHNTVDTFAKKLFLNDNYDELSRLKMTLSLFFLIVQFYDGTGSKQGKKAANIHHRYVSLVSAFLEKSRGSIVLPQNVKFITWNYDLQLELALNYFLKDRTSFGDALKIFGCIPNEDNEKLPNPSIVHLNGIAGLFFAKGNGGYRHVIDEIKSSHIDGILENILYIYESLSPKTKVRIDPNDTFYYSWERTDISNSAIDAAMNIMKQTNILVIVGYSFPVFNRELDRRLLNVFKNSNIQKIYYQDPNADKIAFSNTFQIDPRYVHEEKKVDQFFLPFEF